MQNVHQGIAGLSPYQPGKPIDELARELGISDIIKLASNENPRGPSAAVLAALADAGSELTRYPDGGGYALKQALVGFLQADYPDIQPNQITLGNGSNDVLDLVARVAVEPGYEVVVAEHCFVVYPLVTVAAGGTLVQVPAQNYGADLSAMLAAITDKTRLICLANPNNPTGTWVKKSDLVRFLDAVPEHVWVILDEAYVEYVQDPDYPNGMHLLGQYSNLIVTRTFSKAYGLAALRLGYAVSSPAMADMMNRARQPFNCSSLALAGGVAALADQDYVRETVALNTREMARLEDGLKDLGLTWIPSGGNFLTVDCGRPGKGLFDALLKEGVIVRPVAEYGLPNHLRISIGLPEENERFLEAFKRVLAAA